jgi:hypothetical protein
MNPARDTWRPWLRAMTRQPFRSWYVDYTTAGSPLAVVDAASAPARRAEALGVYRSWYSIAVSWGRLRTPSLA